jgi:hypothetical protein
MKRVWIIFLFVAAWGLAQDFSLAETLGENWASGAQGWEEFVPLPLGEDLSLATENLEGWKALSWTYITGTYSQEEGVTGEDPSQRDHNHFVQSLPLRVIGDWRKKFQVLETGEIITKDYSIGWIHPEDSVESGAFLMTYSGDSDDSRALIILVEGLAVLERRDQVALILDQFID